MTMFHLGQHPEVYERLVKEVRTTFQTYDAINSREAGQKIPYLDAVLNEAMRVTPVLPGPMWRRTDNPIVVCGYPVPGGTELGALRYNIFRNPKAFHEPEKFKPQRWMEDMGDDLEASVPFGESPDPS
jgi:cytochrome P450